jgi:hypothetical protein
LSTQVIEYEQKKLEILREAERKAAEEQRHEEQAQREAVKRQKEWDQQMQRKQALPDTTPPCPERLCE